VTVAESCEHGFAYRPNCHLCHPEKFPPHGTLAKYEQGCRCDECSVIGDCICGEINARHCPVHNDQEADRG
jgi:hypothetical protein